MKNKILSLFNHKSVYSTNNKKSTLITSIIAGVFISFGAFLMLSVGSVMDSPTRLIGMASVFSLALMLITFLGGQLFTGHCMYQTGALMEKKVKLSDFCYNLVIIWLGNLIGAVITTLLFFMTNPNESLTVITNIVSINKVSIPLLPLFIKGIFCNIFVCLAILLSAREDNMLYKMFIIWWCIFAFVMCGFEHSIANMSVLSLGYLSSGISFSDAMYNLLVVTGGNILGGGLLAYVYLKYMD